MSTTTRVAGFVVGLVAVFAAGIGLGRAFGPADSEPGQHEMAGPGHSADHGSGHGSQHGSKHSSGHGSKHGSDHGDMEMGDGLGLSPSQDGYTLSLADASLESGAQTLAFTITGPGGTPVTSYDTLHERRLHLIVVRGDLTGYQHLHPRLDAAGQWSVVAALRPGGWRVIADFIPSGGEQTTLGVGLRVGAADGSTPLGPDTRTARVDGYDVSFAGDLSAGTQSALHLSVTRGGQPVTDLQPYLGAYGHLVMLRAGDLGYVHVHPLEGPSGPALTFQAEAPAAGRYRLFLDFRHDGVVRTATFTVTVP